MTAMHPTDPLESYLAHTLGQTVQLRPAKLRGIPLHVEHAFRLWRTALFGREFVLAELGDGVEVGPKRLAAALEVVRHAAPDAHVAVVLPHVTALQRQRLIRAGVPFIVPGRQTFLPSVLVDLREHFPRAPAPRPTALTAAAQFVVLRQVLWGDVEGVSLADVARTCGYTAMTLTNARNTLVAAGLCGAATQGRAKPLRFAARGRELWDMALPLLGTPVKKTMPVGVITRRLGVLEAGLTALARHTRLAAPSVATLAADARALRRAVADGTVLLGATEDEAAKLVQAWAYDPVRLARGDVVDPLSLWLSLRDDPDERVQAALAELLEGVW